MKVVLDTSTLIFWTLDPVSLSQAARQAISSADQCIVSSISLWEIGTKQRKGKLSLPGTFLEYVKRAKSIRMLEILAVDTEIWVSSVELPWQHNDPADRVIVATAEILNAPLLASDSQIRAFYSRTIW